MMKNLIERNVISSNQTNLSKQIKIVVLTFLATIIPVTLIFIGFKLKTQQSLDLLTRDPLAISNANFYIGMISNIGILFWCACAAICLFSSVILRQNSRYRESRFLLFSGLLTSFLMLDDLFMLHELVLPVYLRISEYVVYAIYLGVVVSFFIKNIKAIKKTEFVILLAATGFLGLSIVCDTLISNLPIFVEDVFKFLGITSWFTYFTRLCLQEVSSVMRLSSSPEVF